MNTRQRKFPLLLVCGSYMRIAIVLGGRDKLVHGLTVGWKSCVDVSRRVRVSNHRLQLLEDVFSWDRMMDDFMF